MHKEELIKVCQKTYISQKREQIAKFACEEQLPLHPQFPEHDCNSDSVSQ